MQRVRSHLFLLFCSPHPFFLTCSLFHPCTSSLFVFFYTHFVLCHLTVKDLDFQPIVAWDDGWKDTIKWFQSNWLPGYFARKGSGVVGIANQVMIHTVLRLCCPSLTVFLVCLPTLPLFSSLRYSEPAQNRHPAQRQGVLIHNAYVTHMLRASRHGYMYTHVARIRRAAC